MKKCKSRWNLKVFEIKIIWDEVVLFDIFQLIPCIFYTELKSKKFSDGEISLLVLI